MGKRKEPEADRGEDPDGKHGGTPLQSSIKKGSRFGDTGNSPARGKGNEPRKPPAYKFKRVFAEGARELFNDDDRHTEFTMAIRSMIKEAKKVDADFSVQPLEENDDGLVYYDPTDVPLNHTDLQANIMISERSSFEKQKPWGKGAEEVDK